jgi:hypothetical protein
MSDDATGDSAADEVASVPAADREVAGGAVPEISASAGRYFRNARYLIVAAALAVGFWFGHDGWINWPAENAKIADLEKRQENARSQKDDAEADRLAGEQKRYSFHSDMDLLLQKVLAVALPVLGVCYLVYTLYRSRGRMRLAADVLYVPGHPPIAASSITRIDDRAWDRKGISRVYYQLQGSAEARVVLDDFVYDHKPIRAIHDRLVSVVATEDEEQATGSGSGAAGVATDSRATSDLET